MEVNLFPGVWKVAQISPIPITNQTVEPNVLQVFEYSTIPTVRHLKRYTPFNVRKQLCESLI